MSEVVIKDGSTGKTAGVDDKNRLMTFSTNQSDSTHAACNGDLFNINTETINLTTDTASSLVYMKNIDTVPWIFTRIFYNAEISANGSGGSFTGSR